MPELPPTCADYCGPIPRDPVAIDDWVPAWANTGWLLNGEPKREGTLRRCEPCGVTWHGGGECFACGGPS